MNPTLSLVMGIGVRRSQGQNNVIRNLVTVAESLHMSLVVTKVPKPTHGRKAMQEQIDPTKQLCKKSGKGSKKLTGNRRRPEKVFFPAKGKSVKEELKGHDSNRALNNSRRISRIRKEGRSEKRLIPSQIQTSACWHHLKRQRLDSSHLSTKRCGNVKSEIKRV